MEPSELIGVHKLLLSSLRTTLMEPRADQLTLCGIRGTHWRLQPDELLTDRPRRSFIASTVGRAAVARQGRKVAEQIHSAARKMISHACLSQATKIARLVPANYSGMLSGQARGYKPQGGNQTTSRLVPGLCPARHISLRVATKQPHSSSTSSGINGNSALDSERNPCISLHLARADETQQFHEHEPREAAMKRIQRMWPWLCQLQQYSAYDYVDSVP